MPHLKPPYDYRLNKPCMSPILEITEENARVKTFIIDYRPLENPVAIQPGQFVMVWVQGNDEIPMSLSYFGTDFRIGISVADIGETTHLLHQMKVGDKVGIRGPYGNNYNLQPGTAIIIGGGIGMASVLPLIEQAAKSKKFPPVDEVIVIEGAKTESELLFGAEIEALLANNASLEYCTDDGTCGFKGFTTQKLDELLEIELNSQKKEEKSSPITVYACGPEIMLKKIFDICEARNLPVQVSLERMMRCGFGICGLCALEPTGLLVCKDGPIFENKVLKEFTDFGHRSRDFAGRPHPL